MYPTATRRRTDCGSCRRRRACVRVMTPSWRRRRSSITVLGRRAGGRRFPQSRFVRAHAAVSATRARQIAEGANCGGLRRPSAARGSPARESRSASSRRHAPTGSMLTAASLPSGRLASGAQRQQLLPGRGGGQASGPSTCAGRTARAGRPRHRDRQDRRRGHRDAPARRPTSSPWCRGCAPRRRCRGPPRLPRASGLLSASPTSGTPSTLSPAEFRLPETPVAPSFTCLPTSAIVATAECTARPTNTQMVVHTDHDDVADQLTEAVGRVWSRTARTETHGCRSQHNSTDRLTRCAQL